MDTRIAVMPLTIAEAGSSPATPETTASADLPAGPGSLRPGASSAVAAEPADAVEISDAARARQRLDPSVLTLQQLGSLLERFEQVTNLAARSNPSTLLGLAGEIGVAAHEVGLSFVEGGDAPGSLSEEMPPGLPAGLRGLTSPATEPCPTESATALQVSARADVVLAVPPAPASSASPPLAGAGERDGTGAKPIEDRHAKGGSYGPGLRAYAPTLGDDAAIAGPTREMCAVVAIPLLRRASAALALVRLWLLDVPAPAADASGRSAAASLPGAVADVIRCEAQVSLAMAQVTGGRHQVDDPRRGRSGSRGRIGATLVRCGAGWHGGDESRQLSLARTGFVAVLLCAAAIVLWIATTLDLTGARIVCAAISVVLCLTGTWRAVGSRVPRRLSVNLDLDRTP